MTESKAKYSKVVLVCPLDWGLGHATRMVPVINELLNYGCKVVLAVGANPKAFLETEFGNRVTYCEYPGKKITFSTGGMFFLKMVIELPLMMFSVLKEHLYLKRIVKDVKPDIIISDNRYGAWNRSAKSIFVTHQLFIHLPHYLRWFNAPINLINHFLVSRFDSCWIPDCRNTPGLAGQLAHKAYSGNRVFVGPLSRFENLETTTEPLGTELLPDKFILVILSGPEPQRTTFERQIIVSLKSMPSVIFRGLPGRVDFRQNGVHYLFDNPTKEVMAYCLKKCSLVISRSGYSTIMDLSVFGARAVFIPTPGQPEQQYLAMLNYNSGYTVSLQQNKLHMLPEAIGKAIALKGLPVIKNGGVLSSLLEATLSGVKCKI